MVEDFTHKGIETFEYDDDPPLYGFQSEIPNLVMAGDIRTAEKLFKLNFFLANHREGEKKLPKGGARKKLCEYIAMLLKRKIITDDYTFYLEADPNYGGGGSRVRSMKGLTDMYKSMTFKIAGTEKFGNIPMTTTIKKFMEWCKKNEKEGAEVPPKPEDKSKSFLPKELTEKKAPVQKKKKKPQKKKKK